MAEEKIPLTYKGHPLRRKDNLIYYGSMADKYIIMLQVLDTKKVDDLDVATKVSVQLQLTDPDLRRTASTTPWTWPPCGWSVRCPTNKQKISPPDEWNLNKM